MRDILLPVALLLVVVTGVGVYLWMTTPAPATDTVPITHSVSKGSSSEVPLPPPARHGRKAMDIHPETANSVPREPEPVKLQDHTTVSEPLQRIATGTPDQVNVGMDVERVVELLGKPNLTALSIREGSLAETYIYKKEPGQDLALIHLTGGRVVSAH